MPYQICKFKNQNQLNHQAQDSHLVGLQIPPFAPTNLFQEPQTHKGIQLKMIHTQNVDHLANSWKLTQVDFSFGF